MSLQLAYIYLLAAIHGMLLVLLLLLLLVYFQGEHAARLYVCGL